MADITLISGSTLGGAEYVAEHLAEKLEDAGFSTETLHGPLLEDLPTAGIWLLITSTHGAGDILTTCNLCMTNCWSNNQTCQPYVSVQSVSAAVNMTPSVVQ